MGSNFDHHNKKSYNMTHIIVLNKDLHVSFKNNLVSRSLKVKVIINY